MILFKRNPKRIIILLMVMLVSQNLVLASSTIPKQSSQLQQVTNGVQNTTTLELFNTIQDAINDTDTLNGHTLTVAAGIYNELVTVNKQLTILGANAGVNPNTGVRGAESIIRPPVSTVAFADEFDGNTVVDIVADNVLFDGFTIDGDATTVTTAPNGFLLPGGERIDAAYGILASNSPVTPRNNVTTQNNILTNISGAGIWFYYPGYGLITNNRFINLDAPSSRGGLTTESFYADVTNNVFIEVQTGWQTNNMYAANPNPANPARVLIQGNTFNVNNLGIYFNLHYSASPNYTVSDNIIRPASSPSSNLRGMQIFSVQQTIDVDFDNNTIQGTPATPFNLGMSIWNNPTSNTVTITNSLVEYAVVGIDVYDCNLQFGQADTTSVILDTIEIRNTSSVGLRVFDNFFPAPTANGPSQTCSQAGPGGIGFPSTAVTVTATNLNFNNNAGLAAVQVTTDPTDPQGASNDPELILDDSTITGGTTPQQILLDGNGRLNMSGSFINGNNNNIIGVAVNSANNYFDIDTSHIYNHRPNHGVVITQTGSDVSINDSCFYNNAFGVQNNSGMAIDANNNWWGAVTGPSTTGIDPTRDAVSADVDFTGFLTTAPTVAGVLCPESSQPPEPTPEPTPNVTPEPTPSSSGGFTPAQLGVTQLPATGETPLWATYLRAIQNYLMGYRMAP